MKVSEFDINIISDDSESAGELIVELSKLGISSCGKDNPNVVPAGINLLFKYSNILSAPDIERFRGKLLVNLHNSLLPNYRGFHAFSWAIENGEEMIGYTLHHVVPKVDSGLILGQLSFNLSLDCDVNCAFRIGQPLLKSWLPNMLLAIKENPGNFCKNRDQIYPVTNIFKRRGGPHLISKELTTEQLRNSMRASNPPYGKGVIYRSYSENEILVLDLSPECSNWFANQNNSRDVVVNTLDGDLKCKSLKFS